MRDARDLRDLRDFRDLRDSRDFRDHRDPMYDRYRDMRDSRDPMYRYMYSYFIRLLYVCSDLVESSTALTSLALCVSSVLSDSRCAPQIFAECVNG